MIRALGAFASVEEAIRYLEEVLHAEQVDALQLGRMDRVAQLEVARTVVLAAWSELLSSRRCIERAYSK